MILRYYVYVTILSQLGKWNLIYFAYLRIEIFFYCGLPTFCILHSLQARWDAPFLSSRKIKFYVSLRYVIQFWHAVTVSFTGIVLNEKLIAWYGWMDLKESTHPHLSHINSIFHCSYRHHYYWGCIRLCYLCNRFALNL